MFRIMTCDESIIQTFVFENGFVFFMKFVIALNVPGFFMIRNFEFIIMAHLFCKYVLLFFIAQDPKGEQPLLIGPPE